MSPRKLVISIEIKPTEKSHLRLLLRVTELIYFNRDMSLI